jgi:shikimate kinase
VETISRRIAEDATTSARRPNLTAAGGVDEIRAVLAAREPLYRESATVIVETMGKPVDAVVEEIVAALAGQVGGRP